MVVWRLDCGQVCIMILNFWCYMLNSASTGNSLNTEAVMETHEHVKDQQNFSLCLNCKVSLFPILGVGVESIHLPWVTRFPCHNNSGQVRVAVMDLVTSHRKVSTLLGHNTQEPGSPKQCGCWCSGQWQPEVYLRAASNSEGNEL